jgi:hypothetical protein
MWLVLRSTRRQVRLPQHLRHRRRRHGNHRFLHDLRSHKCRPDRLRRLFWFRLRHSHLRRVGGLATCPTDLQDIGTYMGMGMAVAGLGR